VATIEGSITSLGRQYVLGLKAVNCQTGDSLAEEQVTADGKEEVLDALGTAATRIRKKLGESLASVEKYDAPPESVTTPSLDALRAYTLGWRAWYVNSDVSTAVPFLQEAVRLDPNFAMAYAVLGGFYSGLGETGRALESIRKAYELRGRVSERERFFIESAYHLRVTGDLELAQKINTLWRQTYPRDPFPHSQLGGIYATLGECDKELAEVQSALKLDPGSGIDYASLVITDLALYRVDEARAAAREAQARQLDSLLIHLNLYLADFLQHDPAGMEREAAGLVGKTAWEDLLLCYESDSAAYAGQFAKARELTRRAAELAERAEEPEEAASYDAEAAVREVLIGNPRLAVRQAQLAVARSNGRDVEAISAIALGLGGDLSESLRLADELSQRFPRDTIVQTEYLPMIRAARLLGGRKVSREKAGEAVEALAVAAPYEQGDPSQTLDFAFYPAYLRGEAYLAARQAPAAVAEFRKIIERPGIVLNEPIGSLAHLGLARSLAASGDFAGARRSYQNFFEAWKNADPGLPLLEQAKAECARIQ
jgi:Flp pilus assembly protein TadD